MRLLLTTVRAGVVTDLAADLPDGARTRDLAAALGTGSPLFHGTRLLPDEQVVADGPLHDAAIVGVGGPVLVTPPPAAVAELRVLSGAGAGTVVRLGEGEFRLGSDPGGDIYLAGLPAYAATLVVRAGPEVVLLPAADPPTGAPTGHPVREVALTGPFVLAGPTAEDPGAALETCPADDPVPPLHLRRRPVTAGTRWPVTEPLAIGSLLVGLAAARPSAVSSGHRHRRRPRLLPPDLPAAFALPKAPEESEPPPWPVLVAVLPVVLGVAAYLLTGLWQSLLFLALSPVLAIGGAVTARRTTKRRHRAALAHHTRTTGEVLAAALGALREEERRRPTGHPDPATVADLVTGDRDRLWERARDDPDALDLRIGTADRPSRLRVSDPGRAAHEGDLRWSLPDVPVTLDLPRLGAVAMTGHDRHALGRWLVAQAVVLHAPSALAVLVLSDDPDRWRWARWLPLHPAGGIHGPGGHAQALERLGALVSSRAAHPDPGAPRVLVLLDGVTAPEALLVHGPTVGVHPVCLAASPREVPAAVRTVVHPDVGGALTVRTSGAEPVEVVRPDLVGEDWATTVARALAPVRDAGGDQAGLPRSCRLLEVLALEPAPAAVLDRWTGEPGLRAVLGVRADGRPAVVDLAADGPHALVAGTTGSGKSELLQTLVAGLAAQAPPDALSFVLVDYKGGAAFRGCARLPHTLGVVTDLDAHLTRRALTSLRAELHRRETVLAAAGASDLAEHETKRGTGARLARLVIVVDEFATLAAELPDFVSGLVDVARRGRSLGVHLVLATQRPAGAVSAEIRANTALRIALRVTDPADSLDVVAVPDAARLAEDTPGRAVVRRGAAAPDVIQTARVSARPEGDGVVTVRPLDAPPASPEPGPGSGETDLDRLAEAMRAAATGIVLPPAPWLPPLPEHVVTRDLPEPATATCLPFGLSDLPEQQRRAPAELDLTAGRHLAIVGAARTGRTTALRTIAAAACARDGPADVHVHVVDCGGGGLLPLAALPHVGTVVTRDQHDRLSRLTARLQALVRARQSALASGGHAGIAEQRAVGADAMAWVLVLVDQWDTFVATYDALDGGSLVQAWQHLLTAGPGVGITVVATGDRSLLHGRASALRDRVLLLRTIDPSDATAVGLSPSAVPAARVPGRGFVTGGHETQVALLDEDPSGAAQTAALREIGARAAAAYADVPATARAFRLEDLPTRLSLASARALPDADRPGLLLGVGGDCPGARHLDPVDGPAFLVAGPRRSGRSSVLLTVGLSALARGLRVAVLAPRGGPLTTLLDGGAGEVSDADDLPPPDAPGVLLVDDLERLDPDSALGVAVTDHLARLDGGAMLVAAGAASDLAALYRGPAVALRRAGSGVLLDPRSAADADLFGVRLPRSTLAAGPPPGAGWLVRDQVAERLQVADPGVNPRRW